MIGASPARLLRPPCPHGRLFHLLARYLSADVQIKASELKQWASANFIGARHIFTLQTSGSPPACQILANRLQVRLANVEWAIAGHIIADIAVRLRNEHADLLLEILTVEE